jgi:hypothetical protein
MNNERTSDINTSVQARPKPIFNIGNVTVVLLDKQIVKLLKINEETLFEQQLVEDGILLRKIG